MADEVRMTEGPCRSARCPTASVPWFVIPRTVSDPRSAGAWTSPRCSWSPQNHPEDFTPPDDIDPGDIAWVLEKPARRLKSARDRWGARADELLTAWIPG